MTYTAPTFVFDFESDREVAGRPARLRFADPVRVITAHSVDEVVDALRAVREAAAAGLWAAGYVAYEAAPAFDAALAVRGDDGAQSGALPLLHFGVFEAPMDSAAPLGDETIEAWTGSWQSDVSREDYEVNVAAIQEAIARGETYQVNYTRRLTLPAEPGASARGDSAFAFYERLRRGQGSRGYAAYLDLGRFRILSASPELFFETRGREIVTRPMKGTAPRGRWSEEDAALGERLAASEKERAENVMIVDLLRSDLGRIAAIGSVRTRDLFQIERYPTVFQMTSTVAATLRDEVRLEDIFTALFPCGSVTGAPKVSTMGHIADLETSPRGVYCGAIGIVRPGGDATFSVAIRTAVLDTETGVAVYGVGGGITSASSAAQEWAETEAKSAVLTDATATGEQEEPFDLLETLLLSDSGYALRDRHLARLRDSAAYFGRPADLKVVQASLDAFANAHGIGSWRVRLLVATDGTVRVEGAPLNALPERRPAVVLAAGPVDRRDRFLFHKTTRRAVYECHRRALPTDVYDVLLWNAQGEVTEFTTGNLIVAQPDGRRVTPARDCGLLAGTLRAELLESGDVVEAVVTVEEVSDPAARLFFVNGVRAIVAVRLADR